MEPILEVVGLRKRFSGFELREVSFTLERGYIMGFIGPNGAGKTTTIKLIMNLLKKDRGIVKIFGLENVKKDLLIQKSYLFYLIFVALIAIISFSGLKRGDIFLPVTFILTYVFMQHACYCDDKNNAHLLLNSLPLSRKKIVLSRYLSLFVFFTISLGFCAALGWISELIFSDFIHFSFPAEGVAAVLAAALLMNSIGLPVFYTFGYSKARIVNVILFIGIFNAFLFLESAGKFIANFFNKGSLFSGYFVLIIAFFIYALSYSVSAKIYSKREF